MQMALGLPQAGHMTGRQALRQKGPLTASALTTAVKAAPTVLRPCPFKPTNAAPRTHSSTQASATYGTALRTAGTKLKQQQLCSSFTRPISLRRAAPKGRPPHAVPINGAPVVQEDIPIHYINATGLEDPEFEVVVFQRDENSANARYKDVAWKVIKAQSGAEFTYTMSLQVAATYQSGGTTIWQGPFNCELGDTWAIKHQSTDSTPLLNLKSKGNALDTLVVQNIKPATFTGKMYNVMLLKDGSPLVCAQRVGVSSQVLFQLKPTVYFGVVYGIVHGKTFNSYDDSCYNTPFNLMEYGGSGLKVTLTYNNESGEYTFTGEAL